MTIEPGKRYVFNYPNEFTTLPDYTAHSGQQVMVIAEASREDYDSWREEEGGELMFEVRADDGWCGFAYAGELSEVPS